ncbi:MAG TPA: peptide ABC transporter substrate-binding protein [Verrucomicrobiae bacterium]|nr:peptide ABC transporter substrate-binding protein [Verrucomicrobiae bacterium]
MSCLTGASENSSGALRRFGGTAAPPTILPAILYLLSSILSASLITGCARSGPPADLVIINGAEPESLDPALLTGQADGRVALALFEGLTRYNPTNGAPAPGLATRWEISPDGKVYTFYLRSNAVWSTGEPITAHDFVYSWLRALDPATASEYAGVLFYVKNGESFNTGKIKDPSQVGANAIDDRTLQVELVNPTPYFIDLCAYPTLAAVPRQSIERHGDRWLMTRPVPTSGAYELVAWRLNDRIRLRKNPRYWDAAGTQNEIVDLLPCVNANTALNLYETGAADIVWDKNLVPVEMLDLLLKRPDFHRYDFLGTYFYRYNVTKKPFDDPRVRQAFALVIDKRRIVERITRGGERIASGYTPPGVGGYQPPEGLGYAPERARRLLAEAGFPEGKGFPSFHFLFDTSSKVHEQIAIELQEMWRRELGIKAELRKLEWKTYLRAQAELDFDVCRSSWIGDYNDPNTFLDMFMSNNGNNRTGWKSARYDQLLREANAEIDPSKRFRSLQEAEKLLVREDAPIVPLYIYTGIEYYDSNRIKGIFPNLRAEHPLRAIRKVKLAAGQ